MYLICKGSTFSRTRSRWKIRTLVGALEDMNDKVEVHWDSQRDNDDMFYQPSQLQHNTVRFGKTSLGGK